MTSRAESGQSNTARATAATACRSSTRAPAQEPGLSEAEYQRLRETLGPLLLEHQGHLNPVPGKEVAKAAHKRNDRLPRKAMRRMLKEDWLILSSTSKPAGFFLGICQEEVDAYLRSLDSRIREDLERRRDVKRLAARRFGGVCQLRLPLMG